MTPLSWFVVGWFACTFCTEVLVPLIKRRKCRHEVVCYVDGMPQVKACVACEKLVDV